MATQNIQLKDGNGNLLMPKTVTPNVNEILPLWDSAQLTTWIINANNKWNLISGQADNNQGAFLSLSGLEGKSLNIQSLETSGVYVSFLKNLTRTNNGSPNFSDNHIGRHVIVANTAQTFTITADMKFAFFNVYANQSNKPKDVNASYSIQGDSTLKSYIYKSKTFKPSFCGGNPINTTVNIGEKLTFGVSEITSLTKIWTPLYNVMPNSTVLITGGNSNLSIQGIIVDKDYNLIYVKQFRLAGDAWSDISFDVPSFGVGVVLGIYNQVDGVMYPSADIDITATLNVDNPILFYPRPIDSGYQHLTMKIALTNMQSNDYEPTNALQVETIYKIDHGILYLPENYTPDGEPVRLIVFTHGSAVSYTSSSTRFNSSDIKPEYWASEGYAIMDMDGLVEGSYGSLNHAYEPAFINAYETAYQWVISHYNVRRDGVFTTGRSLGGGSQFSLCKTSSIPIIASAPMVSLVYPFGMVMSGLTGAQRKALLSNYGVPQDELDAVTWTTTATRYDRLSVPERNLIVKNQWRFAPYSPGWIFNRPITDEEVLLFCTGYWDRVDADLDAYFEAVKDFLNISLFKSVPFRLYTCVGDPTVNYRGVELQHKLLTYAGALAQIHVFPACSDHSVIDSDHRFEINPENLVTYTNSKGQTLQNVPKVYIETLAFWRRFENQDSID